MLPLPRELICRLTDPTQERNIYAHPNPLARHIFWQRLTRLLPRMQECLPAKARVLDFGGGSGAFLPALCAAFGEVDVVDLDPADARRIAGHFRIQNCRILQEDIRSWKPDAPYDVVVATDVLEHFPDLDVPVDAILSYLGRGGHLAISVPTENWLYLLGRVLVRKTKPADHYHPGEAILSHLQRRGLQVRWKGYAPVFAGVPVPLFRLAILGLPEVPVTAGGGTAGVPRGVPRGLRSGGGPGQCSRTPNHKPVTVCTSNWAGSTTCC